MLWVPAEIDDLAVGKCDFDQVLEQEIRLHRVVYFARDGNAGILQE
jgi:hypothetical protein